MIAAQTSVMIVSTFMYYFYVLMYFTRVPDFYDTFTC